MIWGGINKICFEKTQWKVPFVTATKYIFLNFCFVPSRHNITEWGYFAISEVFCLFSCVSLRGGDFTFFLFYLRLFTVSFCYVLSELVGAAVFLARLCWYCWFHRASSSPLIVGSVVPGSAPAFARGRAAWHGESVDRAQAQRWVLAIKNTHP